METVANSVVRTMSGPCKRLTKKNSLVSGNSSLMIGIVMEAEVSPGGKSSGDFRFIYRGGLSPQKH